MKKYIIPFFTLIILMAINACTKDKTNPISDFSFTSSSYIAPSQVLFENKSKGATSYSWSFGDGTNSTEINPIKTYNLAGVYIVTLTATGEGGSSSTSKPIIIGVPKPILALNKIRDTIGLPNNTPRSIIISNVGPPGSILDYLITDADGYLDIQNPSGSLSSGSSATFSVYLDPIFFAGFWNNGNISGSNAFINVNTPQASNYTLFPVEFNFGEDDTYMMADVNGSKWLYCTPPQLQSFVANGRTHIGRNGGYTCNNNVDVVALEINNLNGTGTYSLSPSTQQGWGWFKPPTTVLNWGTYPNGGGTVTITRFDAIYIAGRFNFISEYQGNYANISNGFFKVRKL